jgi:Fe-S cluster assembly protein SufD
MADIKTNNKEWYVSSFKKIEESLNGQSKSPFHELRKNALSKFEQFDFPTTKNEDWKYTNVSAIHNYDFTPVSNVKITKEEIKKHLIPGLEANLVVLVNGNFSSELSDIKEKSKGIIIESFRNVLQNNPEFILKYFAKYAEIENGFVALNTAFANDGVVIYAPENTVIENPVLVINLTGSADANVLSQPRNLIVAEKNAQLKVVELFHSIADNESLTNAVSEIVVEENANVEIYKIQSENLKSFHINRTQAHQSKNCVFTIYNVTLGGLLVRNDTHIVLDDENSTGNLYGLYLTDENQHVDNHTLIDHAKPHCQSNELFKGVLNGNSRGVFNGKVFVRKDAQKTNAYQSNKAILLTDTATIDTKPQLEIYADDVKCSHGAAIGQLDYDAVFYLRSRGIGEEMAKTVLIRAFANDIFDLIPNEKLHEYLNNLVQEKLK